MPSPPATPQVTDPTAIATSAAGTATVLVVDDDPSLRRMLRTGLAAEGYAVIEAASGTEALQQLGAEPPSGRHPDICLLDLGLPDIDGIDLIHRIRQATALPIIVLSVRDHEEAKVEALDFGADDFVTKPFGMGELLARLRTALRHRGQDQGGPSHLRIKDMTLDLVRGEILFGDKMIRLSATEFRILRVLAQHAGRILTHQQIIAEVWGTKVPRDIQYLRVYIRALRQKIEPDPARPAYILTESGVGYRLHAADEPFGSSAALPPPIL
ncbi:MAG: response regulator transcription factor [Azospirillaceae bacterium]|nr:response regulator transcription factor [Azospirillaceae bacterium]